MNDDSLTQEMDAAMKSRDQQRLELARATAGAYARLFSSEDGKHVLADLRKKFGHERPRYDLRDRNLSNIRASLIDGECNVLREIEQACKAGGLTV